MKTMKHLKKLSKLFKYSLFLLIFVSANLFAETKWEVATVFLGSRENEDYQQDVDKNLKELQSIKKSPYLSISSFRPKLGTNLDREKLKSYLKTAFKDPLSRKMLVMYGHGNGPMGLTDLPTKDFQKLLSESKIKLDIIWLDACFQANLEFLTQLRAASTLTIASEEAEFSAGLPFSSLAELPQFSKIDEAAINLANDFIGSYSYLNEGKQVEAVSRSSATISVFDNREISTFVNLFKKVPKIINSLLPEEQKRLRLKVQKKFSMDKSELVDLGHMLIELRSMNKNTATDKELTELIRLLNIESVKKLKTNSRLKISAPVLNALMVFGFNDWQNGTKEEYLDNPLFSEILKTNLFILGPQKAQWPVKKFENLSTYISPFAPGINSFQYYFLDSTGKKRLTEVENLIRFQDVIELRPSSRLKGQFLLYTAYTQRVGVKAERYTGLNITLYQTTPSIDYFELDFNQAVNWLKL